MKTIKNKKGNSGYTAQRWNYLSGFEIKKETAQIIIRKVTVHSCGKKVLRLIANDDGGSMRGTEFAPETLIYRTYEDAAEAAEEIYNRDLIDSITFSKNYRDTYKSQNKYKWFDAKATKYEEFAEYLKEGKYKLELVSY